MEKASKNFIANLKKQKREDRDLLFLDNIKIVRDALLAGTIQPQYILTTEDTLDFFGLNFEKTKNKTSDFNDANISNVSNVEKLLKKMADNHQILKIEQSTIESLSDTKTPQKVLCIAYHTQNVVVMPKSNFLVLDGLQDPGNVGTLVRTAKACGFESVFLVDSVNVNNPKLVRSSVGAVLSSNVFSVSRKEFCEIVKKNKLNLLCCDMAGENIFNFSEKLNTTKDNQFWGVVVGNEGQGVSDEVRTLCQKTVKIPMKDGIESLNAAVSGSIVMYEISKVNFKDL